MRVREISNEEGNRPRTAVCHSKDLIEMKRAQVILASAQRFTVQKIAMFSGRSDGYIRILIHSFNEEGLAMLKPRWNPGTATSSPRRPELGWWPSPPAALGTGDSPSVNGACVD